MKRSALSTSVQALPHVVSQIHLPLSAVAVGRGHVLRHHKWETPRYVPEMQGVWYAVRACELAGLSRSLQV